VVDDRAVGHLGSTSTPIRSLQPWVGAAGVAQHRALTLLTILVKSTEVKQGEVSQENAERLPRFDCTEHLRPGVSDNYPLVVHCS
jgi:hypothetical protein